MGENNYTIEKLNAGCRKVLDGQDLDFGMAIVQSYKHDLSVCAKYQAPKEYCVLINKNEQLKPVNIGSLSLTEREDRGEFYYGVSPKLDSKTLLDLFSHRIITSRQDLDNFVLRNCELFALHENQKDYLPYVAKYIVVSMANHFGLRLGFNESQANGLMGELEKKLYSHEAIRTILKYDKQNQCLIVYGFPTEEVLSVLGKYKYSRRFSKRDVKKKTDSLEVWDPEADGVLSIEQLYKEHTAVVRGKVFYSGVLLKPINVDHLNSNHENDKIRSICFTFEKTTYGTVCAFDNNLTEHPLLGSTCRNKMISFFAEDDHKKRELILNLKKCETMSSNLEKDMLLQVSDYLRESNNVNQICVSGNIVTADGYVILGRRSAGSIDNKSIYPGVNGNAEVADGDVAFYNESVYEDYPTIRTDGHRIDFFGEVGRETYGELHQNLSEQEWIAYGVTLSGNKPIAPEDDPDGSETYNQQFRRMHFNIILEHPCDKSFNVIEKESVLAAEAFETKSYLGVKVLCEKNHWTLVKNSIVRGLRSVITHKEVLDSVIAIALFLLAYTPYAAEDSLSLPPSNWIDFCKLLSLVLAGGLVAYELIKVGIAVFRFFKTKKYRKTIRVYKKMGMEDIHSKIQDVLSIRENGKKTCPIFHPASYLSLCMYIANKASDTFYPTDRR